MNESKLKLICLLLALSIMPSVDCNANESLELQYLKSGNFDQAKLLLEQQAQMNPQSAAIQCNLGIALLRLRNYSNAMDHLHRAVGLQPMLAPAWINLAACYVCLGEFDRAIDAYQRVQNLQPASAASIEQLIAFLRKAKSEDETAVEYFDPAWKRWKSGAVIKLFVSEPQRPNFKKIAIQAMKDAATACGANLTVELVSDRSSANVTCDWDNRSYATTMERGIATGKARNGEIVSGAVTIFLSNESGLDCLTDETVRKSCLHEFCHVLGVRGHSTNVQDVMFAIVESPTIEPRLSDRDRQTLRRLYQAPPLRK